MVSEEASSKPLRCNEYDFFYLHINSSDIWIHFEPNFRFIASAIL